MLPRLLSGSGGAIVEQFDAAGYPGWDLFFLISGIASLAALLFLPLIARARPREPDEAEVSA
jgi:PAT family beta-lactamase induction signal transducer AmpG